jgi:hypothetical protein
LICARKRHENSEILNGGSPSLFDIKVKKKKFLVLFVFYSAWFVYENAQQKIWRDCGV